MSILIKTEEEIQKMRVAGRLASEALDFIAPYIEPGITTDKINQLSHDYMVNVQDAIPATLNYRGYPKSLCTSVNHVVCHGIPGPKKLKKGDIINLDIALIKDGYYGDNSRMYCLDGASVKAKRICKIALECMNLGIEKVKPGARLGDIGQVIQQHAEKNNCSVVREYCGHGLGKNFHEDPQVLHYGKAGTGPELIPGMVFTIEPMINLGKRHVKLLNDDWTVVTKDRSLSAQWEHTILVTEAGYEILTLSGNDHSTA